MPRAFATSLAGLALALFAWPRPVDAFQLTAGPAVAEGGDDRLEPAAVMHAGWAGGWDAALAYWGRQYGPVTSETMLVTFVHDWDLYKTKALTAHFGVAAMDEREALRYSQASYQAYDEQKDCYNVGADFGVTWGIPQGVAPLALALSWDSAVFPAGGNGTFFLVTARKQTLALTAGIGF
jgi:hypothetical protein